MSTVAHQPTIPQPVPMPAAPMPAVDPASATERRPSPPHPPQPPEPRADRPYLITADLFLAMIEAEVFPDEARVYLQDGRIYEKMAKTNAHSLAGGPLVRSLARRFDPPYWLLPEGEFRLDDWNAKLPDLAIIRCDDLQARLASGVKLDAIDVALAIEIAATSLPKDLGENLERYARAMIPNYWVADVTARRVFVHAEPRVVDGVGTYGKIEIVLPGGSVDLVLDGQEPVRFAFEDLML